MPIRRSTAPPKDKRVEADYELPFQAHATMEPMNCTVKVDGDHAEVWVPAQGSEWVLGTVAEVTGLKPNAIKVNTTLLGGGFGRRYQADFAAEAGQVAKRVPGKPVQLIWSREDDMTHDYYRPASYHRISGAVDAQGNIVAWRHRSTSTPIAEWWEPEGGAGIFGVGLQHPDALSGKELQTRISADGIRCSACLVAVSRSIIHWIRYGELRGRTGPRRREGPAGFPDFETRWPVSKGSDEQRRRSSQYRATQRCVATCREESRLEFADAARPWTRDCGALFVQQLRVDVVEVSVIDNKLKVNRIVSAVDIGTPSAPTAFAPKWRARSSTD